MKICKHFHQSTIKLSTSYLLELGRHNYVTPTSYLELINAFKTLLGSKQDETLKAKRRYVVGLEKLAFAASQVNMSIIIHSHLCLWPSVGNIIISQRSFLSNFLITNDITKIPVFGGPYVKEDHFFLLKILEFIFDTLLGFYDNNDTITNNIGILCMNA